MLFCKVLTISSDTAGNRLNAMIKNPEKSFYHNLRYSPFPVNTRVSQTTVVLTLFVGNIAWQFVVLLPVALLTVESAYQFSVISNFALFDSNSSHCVGGQVILISLALDFLFYSCHVLVI